jgi:hypothetical protein
MFANLSGNDASVQWGYAMRVAVFALFLSTGTAAFCQTPAPAPLQPNQTCVFPPGSFQPGRDFSKLPPRMHFNFVPNQTLILPRTVEIPHKEKAEIDPKIIVHPPQSGIGEQAPGTMVAQNLYPGLQLLPIDWSKAKGEPIPTTWPNMKIILVKSGPIAPPAK